MCLGPLLLAYIKIPAGTVNTYTHFLEVIYNIIGFVLFLTVAGGLVLENYKEKLKPLKVNDPGVALGAICVANSIVYFIDCLLAISKQRIARPKIRSGKVMRAEIPSPEASTNAEIA